MQFKIRVFIGLAITVYINNSPHLPRKYTCGHYLFREANSFPGTKLEENGELRGTDNIQGQISEHIFEVKWKSLCLIHRFRPA